MKLPAYADLPVKPNAPRGSSWGVWGDNDVFGCLNLLGPERTRRGNECVRSGEVFPLALELELPDPPLFGRPAFRHEIVSRPSGIATDDMLHGWNTQSSTQWDGFRHVRSPQHGAYSGIPEHEHGIHHWARRGIVSRGVLVDVARWRVANGIQHLPGSSSNITAADLRATLEAQHVIVEPGDLLFIRTGWVEWYRTLDPVGRALCATDLHAAGLQANEATAAYLWDLHIAAVAADNPALEMWPPPMYTLTPEERNARLAEAGDIADAAALFLHLALLPMLGMPIGELLDLDALAADCAQHSTYDFFITSAPLNTLHGVATPPNLLAIR